MDARLFTLFCACKEGRLSREFSEIGLDCVRASIGRANEIGDSAPAGEVIDILENPICKNVHPHMLPDDELLEEIFSDELLVQMEKYWQGNIDGARKTARLGLEQCRDELTDLFIWLLADARRNGDKENYKKLYASAKRRQGADIKKIDKSLESGEAR